MPRSGGRIFQTEGTADSLNLLYYKRGAFWCKSWCEKREQMAEMLVMGEALHVWGRRYMESFPLNFALNLKLPLKMMSIKKESKQEQTEIILQRETESDHAQL